MDRMREALSAHLSGGLSPAAFSLAVFDWSIHLASALALRETVALDRFLTHDDRLAIAARGVGFAVEGG